MIAILEPGPDSIQKHRYGARLQNKQPDIKVTRYAPANTDNE